nr:hypothetical protein [uncultured Sediminibacterium sp.]
MKKTLLWILGTVITSASFAQFQKNDRLLSGQVFFNNGAEKNSISNTKVTGFSTGINLSASKFSSPTRFNSIQLSYSNTTNKQESGSNINKFSYNQIGLALGHTMLSQLANRFYLSFPFTGGFSVGNGKTRNNNVLSSSSNSFSVAISANMGLLYQTQKRWVFMANIISLGQISYNNARTKAYNNAGLVVSDVKNNSINFTGGFNGTPFNNLSIGVGYLIR